MTVAVAVLRDRPRLWAVGPVRGDARRLSRIADALAARRRADEPVVFLGNALGRGPAVGETVDLLLDLRRWLLAAPGVRTCDVVFLRGAQEEMWAKALQLQFALEPGPTLSWMAGRGLGAILEAYGGTVEDGLRAARDGPLAVARWTGALREAMRARPGHDAFHGALRRAARTADGGVWFAAQGVDARRAPDRQGDAFWWGGGAGAAALETALTAGDADRGWAAVRRVVRGVAEGETGAATAASQGPRVVSVGGAALVGADGAVLDAIEAAAGT